MLAAQTESLPGGDGQIVGGFRVGTNRQAASIDDQIQIHKIQNPSLTE
jgi:hypothetical protein